MFLGEIRQWPNLVVLYGADQQVGRSQVLFRLENLVHGTGALACVVDRQLDRDALLTQAVDGQQHALVILHETGRGGVAGRLVGLEGQEQAHLDAVDRQALFFLIEQGIDLVLTHGPAVGGRCGHHLGRLGRDLQYHTRFDTVFELGVMLDQLYARDVEFAADAIEGFPLLDHILDLLNCLFLLGRRQVLNLGRRDTDDPSRREGRDREAWIGVEDRLGRDVIFLRERVECLAPLDGVIEIIACLFR